VRATAGTTITDRTFSIDVKGADAPSFTTVSGQLQMEDSTRVGLYWIIDGSELTVQMEATDTDTAAGQTLVYEIVSGTLPPGISMNKKGLVSGVVELTDDQRFGERGGFDASNEHYDNVVYDKTVSTKSISKNFEFTVRVSDGTSFLDQVNSIFVYSADFWRVSNTSVTIDASQIDGSPLTMDYSGNRRPVFRTGSDLGTFRHDNYFVTKIDVEDFDSLQGDLAYTIQSGALPSGVVIDASTGELYGTLARQTAVEKTYTFTVRATRTVSTGITVFSDQEFTMKVIGQIDIGIAFSTPTVVGTLTADIPSTLSIVAVAENTDRVLSYTVSAGSLPPGITLSEQGNLLGTIDPSTITDSTRSYSFTVSVSDQYQAVGHSNPFTVNVDVPHTLTEYGNMTGHATSFIDQNIFYNVAQDPSINSQEYIYRGEDKNFGMKSKPEMLMISGLKAQTLTAFQNQMSQNHAPKQLYFGDVKTAVAKENGTVKYEVVYIEVKDNLVNNQGVAVSNSLTLRDSITKQIIGPRASTMNTTTDRNVYEITTDGGLSFSTAGSKARFANQLSADLGFITKLYPNAVANMRSRMKSLGHKEWTYLPQWMRTTQAGDLAPLGFILAVPICYCKPGTSALVKKRIQDKKLIFKNISFIVDRYTVSKSVVSPETFVGDGSTKAFVLNELVHEQDILVKEGTKVVFVGQGVTSDNVSLPTYLTADGTLRSTDHELGITLSHNTTTMKTTVTFTKETPADGTIIRVERANDKYLKFRNEGI
tara:strand:- start:1460 stop:3748 length:2289 start_codon:yes stop_codon:yes gene_type:complete